jgi:hypothetical protein
MRMSVMALSLKLAARRPCADAIGGAARYRLDRQRRVDA